MKHIPILYQTEMVKAKLAGRKTQTRRIINPQPDNDAYYIIEPEQRNDIFGVVYNYNLGDENPFIKCPYGQSGDILWTRETWVKVEYVNKTIFEYKAGFDAEPYWPWKPGIHMPKSACRMWDEVISIRAERVADISEEDAIAEGIQSYTDETGIRYKDYMADASGYGHPEHDYPTVSTAIYSYRSLWQKINGTASPIQKKVNGKLITTAYEVYPFDEEAARPFAGMSKYRGKPLTVIVNPWVWCISFVEKKLTEDEKMSFVSGV